MSTMNSTVDKKQGMTSSLSADAAEFVPLSCGLPQSNASPTVAPQASAPRPPRWSGGKGMEITQVPRYLTSCYPFVSPDAVVRHDVPRFPSQFPYPGTLPPALPMPAPPPIRFPTWQAVRPGFVGNYQPASYGSVAFDPVTSLPLDVTKVRGDGLLPTPPHAGVSVPAVPGQELVLAPQPEPINSWVMTAPPPPVFVQQQQQQQQQQQSQQQQHVYSSHQQMGQTTVMASSTSTSSAIKHQTGGVRSKANAATQKEAGVNARPHSPVLISRSSQTDFPPALRNFTLQERPHPLYLPGSGRSSSKHPASDGGSQGQEWNGEDQDSDSGYNSPMRHNLVSNGTQVTPSRVSPNKEAGISRKTKPLSEKVPNQTNHNFKNEHKDMGLENRGKQQSGVHKEKLQSDTKGIGQSENVANLDPEVPILDVKKKRRKKKDERDATRSPRALGTNSKLLSRSSSSISSSGTRPDEDGEKIDLHSWTDFPPMSSRGAPSSTSTKPTVKSSLAPEERVPLTIERSAHEPPWSIKFSNSHDRSQRSRSSSGDKDKNAGANLISPPESAWGKIGRSFKTSQGPGLGEELSALMSNSDGVPPLLTSSGKNSSVNSNQQGFGDGENQNAVISKGNGGKDSSRVSQTQISDNVQSGGSSHGSIGTKFPSSSSTVTSSRMKTAATVTTTTTTTTTSTATTTATTTMTSTHISSSGNSSGKTTATSGSSAMSNTHAAMYSSKNMPHAQMGLSVSQNSPSSLQGRSGVSSGGIISGRGHHDASSRDMYRGSGGERPSGNNVAFSGKYQHSDRRDNRLSGYTNSAANMNVISSHATSSPSSPLSSMKCPKSSAAHSHSANLPSSVTANNQNAFSVMSISTQAHSLTMVSPSSMSLSSSSSSTLCNTPLSTFPSHSVLMAPPPPHTSYVSQGVAVGVTKPAHTTAVTGGPVVNYHIPPPSIPTGDAALAHPVHPAVRSYANIAQGALPRGIANTHHFSPRGATSQQGHMATNQVMPHVHSNSSQPLGQPPPRPPSQPPFAPPATASYACYAGAITQQPPPRTGVVSNRFPATLVSKSNQQSPNCQAVPNTTPMHVSKNSKQNPTVNSGASRHLSGSKTVHTANVTGSSNATQRKASDIKDSTTVISSSSVHQLQNYEQTLKGAAVQQQSAASLNNPNDDAEVEGEGEEKKKRRRRRRRTRRRGKGGNDGDGEEGSGGSQGLEHAISSSNVSESTLHFEDVDEFPDLLTATSRTLGEDGIADRSTLSGASITYSDIIKSTWSKAGSQSRTQSLTGSCVSADNDDEDNTSTQTGTTNESKRARKRRKRREQANKAAEAELAEISLEQQWLKEVGLKKSANHKTGDSGVGGASGTKAMPGLISDSTVVGEAKKQAGGKGGGGGKKSQQPIAFDIAAMIDAIQKKPAPQTALPSNKHLMASSSAPSSAKSSKKDRERTGAIGSTGLPGNILDSSAPVQKRGKEREMGKAKKPSPLKKVILKEREQRKRLRLLDEDPDSGLGNVGSSPGVGIVGGESELSQDALSSKSEGTDREDDNGAAELSADLSPISQTSPISMSPASPGNSGVNSPVTGSIGRDPVVMKIHSRRFREYCTQILDKEIDQCCTSLLQDLVKFQDRMYHKDPVKAKTKRRVVLGLREVTKHLKLKKIKCVVISPNLEKIQSKGGLDEALNNILNMCREQDVPFVFALGRRALGRACAKLVPVSVVGIFNYEGCESKYKSLISLTAAARSAYNEMVLAVEKEVAEYPTMASQTSSIGGVPGLFAAHMGHSRTPSGCSAISFTSSILSEPISENFPHAEPEVDSKGYEIVRDAAGNVVHPSGGGAKTRGGANDFDDGNEADTEDFGESRKKKRGGRNLNSVRFGDMGGGREGKESSDKGSEDFDERSSVGRLSRNVSESTLTNEDNFILKGEPFAVKHKGGLEDFEDGEEKEEFGDGDEDVASKRHLEGKRDVGLAKDAERGSKWTPVPHIDSIHSQNYNLGDEILSRHTSLSHERTTQGQSQGQVMTLGGVGQSSGSGYDGKEQDRSLKKGDVVDEGGDDDDDDENVDLDEDDLDEADDDDVDDDDDDDDVRGEEGEEEEVEATTRHHRVIDKERIKNWLESQTNISSTED